MVPKMPDTIVVRTEMRQSVASGRIFDSDRLSQVLSMRAASPNLNACHSRLVLVPPASSEDFLLNIVQRERPGIIHDQY